MEKIPHLPLKKLADRDTWLEPWTRFLHAQFPRAAPGYFRRHVLGDANFTTDQVFLALGSDPPRITSLAEIQEAAEVVMTPGSLDSGAPTVVVGTARLFLRRLTVMVDPLSGDAHDPATSHNATVVTVCGIGEVCVDAAWRGRGLAPRLVAACEAHAATRYSAAATILFASRPLADALYGPRLQYTWCATRPVRMPLLLPLRASGSSGGGQSSNGGASGIKIADAALLESATTAAATTATLAAAWRSRPWHGATLRKGARYWSRWIAGETCAPGSVACTAQIDLGPQGSQFLGDYLCCTIYDGAVQVRDWCSAPDNAAAAAAAAAGNLPARHEVFDAMLAWCVERLRAAATDDTDSNAPAGCNLLVVPDIVELPAAAVARTIGGRFADESHWITDGALPDRGVMIKNTGAAIDVVAAMSETCSFETVVWPIDRF
jgi:GNAT superfamily N-acetyltransferase